MSTREAASLSGRAKRVARALAIAGVFAGLGPLVGLIAFASGIGIGSVFAEKPADWGAVAAFVTIYGLVFAHFFGAVPALAAGVTVAAFGLWRQRALPPFAGALISAAIGAVYFYGVVAGRGSEAIETWQLVAMYGGASFVAGAVCTALTRRLQG